MIERKFDSPTTGAAAHGADGAGGAGAPVDYGALCDELRCHTSERLEVRRAWLVREQRRLRVEELAVVRVLDERGRVDDSLAAVDGVSIREVRASVATARALEDLPAIAAVAAEGRLSDRPMRRAGAGSGGRPGPIDGPATVAGIPLPDRMVEALRAEARIEPVLVDDHGEPPRTSAAPSRSLSEKTKRVVVATRRDSAAAPGCDRSASAPRRPSPLAPDPGAAPTDIGNLAAVCTGRNSHHQHLAPHGPHAPARQPQPPRRTHAHPPRRPPRPRHPRRRTIERRTRRRVTTPRDRSRP